MKTLAICVLCAIATTAAFSAEKKVYTEAEKAALKEKRMMKTGGIIFKEGVGKIVVVNAQTKYSAADIERNLETFRDFLKVNIEVREGTWKIGDKRPVDANVAMYIIDDAALPMSLVAMEDAWGVMNVSQLTGAKQFDVEFSRVGIATFGAGVSQFKVSPMQTVSKPSDLEAIIKPAITMDSGMSMNHHLEDLGVTKSKMTTYRQACQEGWAAAPTNLYQQAVWNEIHTLPTAPITIEPEKK